MNLLFKCFQRRNWLISGLALLMSVGWSQAVRAEGSKDLIRTGQGFRPFLDYRVGSGDTSNTSFYSGGIPRNTKIYVYANSGEIINLGSSATGIGQGTINYRSPNGTSGTCSPGVGLIRGNNPNDPIANLNAELNRSYIPCQLNVGTDGPPGIWEITFFSPNSADTTDPTPIAANRGWPNQTANNSFITAWDVTVTSSGIAQEGRVYANYLPLNMGNNASAANNITLNSTTYVLTKEGYTYRVDLGGLDPFGFIFFANNKGFRDANGNSEYGSIPANNNENLIGSGRLHNPGGRDEPTDVTHKIFFNPPSQTLPFGDQPLPEGSTWLRNNSPLTIPSIGDFTFTGVDGTPNQAGPTLPDSPEQQGGYFRFNATGPGYYLIAIDIDGNGNFGDNNDVILKDLAKVGLNEIYWNGTDALGRPLPRDTTTGYRANLSFFVGDVHFPLIDPEGNPGGLTITRLDSQDPSSTKIYYNDSPIAGNRSNLIPPPDSVSKLEGIDSLGGRHRFFSPFGDRQGIDTWTSLVNSILLNGEILIKRVDLSVTKTVNPSSLAAGETLTYTINVTSKIPIPPDQYSSVQSARVTDTVPPELTGVSWTCAITNDAAGSVANKCNTTSGSGNNIDLTVDLNVGATATITVTGTVSPITVGTLNNEANVSPPPDVTEVDPRDNTDTEPTTVTPGPVQPAGIKSVRIFEDKDSSGTPTTGDTVEYTITYVNNSSQDITNFQATDPIESDKLDFAGAYSFTASGAGTTITANPNYNGTTDTKLNTIGTLGANGGRIDVKYRALIKAPSGTAIRNQAVATFDGGTVNPSVSRAVDGTGLLPQLPDDGIDQGNFPRTDDDNPTIINVGGNTDGPVRLRLLKRITNIIRGGVPISGINFGSFAPDPNDENDTAPGWSQLPGGSPVGVFDIGTEASLQSGDDVEYTVYFLSDGTQPAKAIKVCDPIPEGTLFIPGSISLTLPSAGSSNQSQTDALNDDRGSFIPKLNVSSPFSSPPCPNSNNPTGAVFVDLGDIPNTAPNNVGFLRFRVRIE